ncbi:DUF1279 domain-containing protein, partial [archaeon]
MKPKDLLTKYGMAYLLTSITLAAISYALCYVLVANGIDVAALLDKVGIKSTQMAASTGMYGIWCMVYDVWYMVYGVGCMVYGVWCMVYGVWYMVYGIWCMVYGIWC